MKGQERGDRESAKMGSDPAAENILASAVSSAAGSARRCPDWLYSAGLLDTGLLS